MSKLHNFVPDRFAQINLDDGTKVLVSLTETDLKVFLLGFFGFPKKTLHVFSQSTLERMRLLDANVLEYVFSQLLTASDIDEITDKCESIEDWCHTILD